MCQNPHNPHLGGGMNRRFQTKCAKYWNFYIIKTTAAIPTIFCTMIKTSNCVLKCNPQIQNGGRPPSGEKWKIAISLQALHKDVHFGISLIRLPIKGSSYPKTPILGGVGRCFQVKRAKYSNFSVIKITAVTPTKFCTMIKTSKYPLRVVSKCATQIQDGGWPPSWKKLKKIVISQQPFDRFWRSVRHYDVFLCKDVPFRGHVDITSPYLVVIHIPMNSHFGAWIGLFKPNEQNVQTFILSKLQQRFQPNFTH